MSQRLHLKLQLVHNHQIVIDWGRKVEVPVMGMFLFTPLDPLRPCSCSKRSRNSKNRKYDHFVSDPCGLYDAGLKAFHFAAAAIRSMWIMGRIIFPAQTLRLSCAGVAMMEGDRGETRTRQLRPRESTCP